MAGGDVGDVLIPVLERREKGLVCEDANGGGEGEVGFMETGREREGGGNHLCCVKLALNSDATMGGRGWENDEE